MAKKVASSRSISGSEAAFARSSAVMPGGVSSPVRAFKAVGGTPIFIREAEGSQLTDVDGNQYIDYIGSYGPLIAGHANERVVAALSKQIGRGSSFGIPNEFEAQLAEKIIGALPAIEMIRFVNSGTEAAMSAIRLARAATGRDMIVKCIGCYHGHVDSMLVQAGSGALTHGSPSSPGVPESTTRNTLLVNYNNLDEARQVLEKYTGQVAAFVLEPVVGNMGVLIPKDGYLQGLRQLCTQHGALLLMDEVMTGFRVGWSGAQGRFGVRPDLVCLGKVIGGGLPVGAYGGIRKYMEMISPSGPVYQAGTLSGNPLAMTAGLSTLEILEEPGCYEALEARSEQLEAGLKKAAHDAGVPLTVNRVGSMLTPFFVASDGAPVTDYASAVACNTGRFGRFFHAMLSGGVYLPPSQFEAWFVSTAHTNEIIEETIEVASRAMQRIL